MDNNVVDNKLNMSLDDIIKKERKAKQRQQNGGIQGTARKRMISKRINKGKRSIAMRPVIRRNRQQAAVNGGLSAAVAMKVVNRLVKKAIRRRANQSLINRAVTLRRRALRRNSAVKPAVRGLRARRQAAVVGSRLAGRLSGLNQRSQVIRRNTGRNALRQPVIFTSPQIVRGRGLSHMGQLASDSESFMVEQREITRPMLQQKVLRREIVAAQPRREVIMQRRTRPVIVEQQPVIIRRGGIRKRAILNEPNVVVVRNAPRRVQFRTQPEFGRMQRVGNVRPRNRIIRKAQYVVNPNAAQMREALGIGLRRSEPQRFESSSTFLQRIPVANRRGRGFQDVLYN
ncbi:FAD-linked oxidoreductase OXR1 [Dirofilaria immitis]